MHQSFSWLCQSGVCRAYFHHCLHIQSIYTSSMYVLKKNCGRCMTTSPYTVSGQSYLSNGNPAIPSLREAPRCLLQERLACMILLMDHDSIWKTLCSSNLGSIAHLADWSFACNSCAAMFAIHLECTELLG